MVGPGIQKFIIFDNLKNTPIPYKMCNNYLNGGIITSYPAYKNKRRITLLGFHNKLQFSICITLYHFYIYNMYYIMIYIQSWVGIQ